MDELLSLLLQLIPVALLAGYWILRICRILTKRRKQREDAAPSSRAVYDQPRGPAAADDEYELHFSAWDLPVTSESEVPESPVPGKPVRDFSAGILTGALIEDKSAGKVLPIPAFTYRPEEAQPAGIPGTGQKQEARQVFRRISRFSLKKAVIWAEILGPPKGL
ncbi:MAG: hypothetical protein LBD78_11700 [Spirochaetaceae bacterium]|jgi:hypothetical protein|nr:hypothetical protein [Spirochaetaceae bacterium]